MQTCMRPSCGWRAGKSRGMATLPRLVDTTSCGSPPSTGTTQIAASTGMQSSLLQHSLGSQLCAGADVGQVPASIEPAIRTKVKFFICRYRDFVIAASFHAVGAGASYIHMRCDSLLRGRDYADQSSKASIRTPTTTAAKNQKKQRTLGCAAVVLPTDVHNSS